MEEGEAPSRVGLCKYSYSLSLAATETSQGHPLPANHPLFAPEPFLAPGGLNMSHRLPRASSPSQQYFAADDRSVPPPVMMRGPSPVNHGPGYAQLPNHGEDMRKLMEESTAARESARVLSEALVYTRPEELAAKPIIQVSAYFRLSLKA